jgi:hypothetical protein
MLQDNKRTDDRGTTKTEHILTEFRRRTNGPMAAFAIPDDQSLKPLRPGA